MFGIVNYWAFLFAGILLNLTPGSDTLYILGRSVTGGRKAGILSALGISTGAIIQTFFAVIGLSVILAQSATAFNVVKYAGAVYLIVLGLESLQNRLDKSAGAKEDTAVVGSANETSYKKIYLSGILTNVLNPKVALFFLTFLPQFVDPTHPDSTVAFLLLGLSFVTTGTIWCLVLALFSAHLTSRINQNVKIRGYLERITGVVFILLGIQLAFAKK